jgi:putative transposase
MAGTYLRPHVPLSIDKARALVARFAVDYNHARLHPAIGYVTPADKLADRERTHAQAREHRATRSHRWRNGTQRKASRGPGARQ